MEHLRSFSALQRAENSSISAANSASVSTNAFQCSSASRKFLNFRERYRIACRNRRFSALQRAENSSILRRGSKMLGRFSGFSALQRAENSSITSGLTHDAVKYRVSVLFSEPKIPQF